MSTTVKATLNSSITDAITALASETDRAKQIRDPRAWLTTMSRSHSYSFNNQLLIATQCPTADAEASAFPLAA